ncbi:MAG: flavin reductase family protein [Xanthobacteraceae bacterium]|uniref:flavin reductase family protein n=1 Tax=Pseudolabrys sp. TaxID=1960880 RepID=UPI003D0F5C7A
MTASLQAMSAPMMAAGTYPTEMGCAVSAQQFRDAMSQITTPVSIITTDGLAGRSGMTCSAVCAASDTPPMIIACVHGASAANRIFKANGVLCVNSLSAAQSSLSQMFASSRGVPMDERFPAEDWGTLATGSPCHRNALTALDCEVLDIREAGTHSVFFAKVLATGIGQPLEPLVYHRRAYATTRSL